MSKLSGEKSFGDVLAAAFEECADDNFDRANEAAAKAVIDEFVRRGEGPFGYTHAKANDSLNQDLPASFFKVRSALYNIPLFLAPQQVKLPSVVEIAMTIRKTAFPTSTWAFHELETHVQQLLLTQAEAILTLLKELNHVE